MKLILYTSDQFTSSKQTTPRVRINMKSGLFTINATAASLIKCQKDDSIIIGNDKDNSNHIIAKAHKNGFKLRQRKNDKSLSFNSLLLARQIASDLCRKDQSFSLRLLEDPLEYSLEDIELVCFPLVKMPS